MRQLDWRIERERIDLAALAKTLFGQAPGRRGERHGRRLWWHCPFHDDPNPSFCVTPGRPWWRCFGCGEHGDAANLVMRLGNMTFHEAKCRLTGGPITAWKGVAPLRQAKRPEPEVNPRPEGWHEAAAAFVADAERALWRPEGKKALERLRGRGLREETIRAARLGLNLRGSEGPTGIVIPWIEGNRPTLVNIRRPDGIKPKYIVLKGSRRGGIFPTRRVILPGRPLVITEGEFDALLLGQELGDLAAVVTLGSASARPNPSILGAMLPAWPWYVATDADEAGDTSAATWPKPVRRVRPPGCFKDWTEAKTARWPIDLRRWWGDILAGCEKPTLYTWEELKTWRWGENPGPEPGIVILRPHSIEAPRVQFSPHTDRCV